MEKNGISTNYPSLLTFFLLILALLTFHASSAFTPPEIIKGTKENMINQGSLEPVSGLIHSPIVSSDSNKVLLSGIKISFNGKDNSSNKALSLTSKVESDKGWKFRSNLEHWRVRGFRSYPYW